MRILFVTDDFSGASLCARLAQEGNDVRAHVGNPDHVQTLDGWINRVPTLDAGLDWVGKDGLIVCDDNGFGPLQDRLRTDGWQPALRVGPTVRGDRGVFANQTIVRGSRLFICGGSVLSLSDEDSLPSECADKPIEISEWFSLGPRTDTDIPLVPQHYVNHSCNPNAGWEGQLTLVALRNILAGEEVCYDYCMVMQSNASSGSYWSMNCECRQSTCRHIIAEDDWTRPELQARYNGFFAWHLQQKIDAVNKGLTLPTFRAHDGKRNGWNWIDNRLISHGSRISNTGLFASAYIPGGTIVFVNGGRVFGINREPLDLSLQILDDFVIGPDVGEESVSDHINHS
jgi:hypothetical protein